MPSLDNLHAVSIPSGPFALSGDFVVPDHSVGVVVFAHGSGSGRMSPRNRRVAAHLQAGGFATLLLDLLTPEEEALDTVSGQYRFDIPMLARRLIDALDWVHAHPQTRSLQIGLFGASTGAAAALIAATSRPNLVNAVVSRGGRPDLAARSLAGVSAPTMLIVGERDPVVLELNMQAQRSMHAETNLVVIPGATHLFEEPGALDEVSHNARQWFTRHLSGSALHSGGERVFVSR